MTQGNFFADKRVLGLLRRALPIVRDASPTYDCGYLAAEIENEIDLIESDLIATLSVIDSAIDSDPAMQEHITYRAHLARKQSRVQAA